MLNKTVGADGAGTGAVAASRYGSSSYKMMLLPKAAAPNTAKIYILIFKRLMLEYLHIVVIFKVRCQEILELKQLGIQFYLK
jgi:hypothetical protein